MVGTYQGNDEPIEIEQGKIENDHLTFQFDLELGQTITIKFDGKVAKDDVEGEVTFETDSDSGSFPWAATRVHLPDRRIDSWRAPRHADGRRSVSHGDELYMGRGG